MIRKQQVTVTTAGANGSATGSGTTAKPLNGRLLAVHIDYTGEPATCDVTIATVGTPVRTLLTKSDSATDAWVYPRVLVQGVTAADLTAIYDTFPIDDYLSVSVAQGDAAGTVICTFFVESYD